VLWQVAEFRYASEGDIYDAVAAVDWPRFSRSTGRCVFT
jgi:23S rRNA G2445 N2-methylase RlmL